jgi:hypothetical protein
MTKSCHKLGNIRGYKNEKWKWAGTGIYASPLHMETVHLGLYDLAAQLGQSENLGTKACCQVNG